MVTIRNARGQRSREGGRDGQRASGLGRLGQRRGKSGDDARCRGARETSPAGRCASTRPRARETHREAGGEAARASETAEGCRRATSSSRALPTVTTSFLPPRAESGRRNRSVANRSRDLLASSEQLKNRPSLCRIEQAQRIRWWHVGWVWEKWTRPPPSAFTQATKHPRRTRPRGSSKRAARVLSQS